MSAPLVLEVRDLALAFGGVQALSAFFLTVRRGEIMALIGPNGAGKTTVFNCLSGLYRPDAGSVGLAAADGAMVQLAGRRPDEIVACGLARTFQNIRLFRGMSVQENVMVGFHCRTRAGVLGAVFRSAAVRAEEERVEAGSRELLRRVGLTGLEEEMAGTLAYGAQRRLEIARALAAAPKLLLLDEPAAGMNPQEGGELMELIRSLRADGISILLIEHDMHLVMRLCDRVTVLDTGRSIAVGSPEQVQADPAVIRAYLGDELDA
ncbi:MAG: ABC transporter ATP-binding protein [Desulfobulbaceae bacterium A2]|nr:MAG: ABC transporter ATP-binding protein [Desulfobulbaceae bacterium A2]